MIRTLQHHVICACSIITLILHAHDVHAGNLDVSGRVVPGTCATDFDSATGRVVTLKDVDVSDILHVNNGPVSSSETPFSLEFSGCTGVAGATLRFSGAGASSDAAQFRNTGTAHGVALHLRDARDESQIPASGAERRIAIDGDRQAFRLKAYIFHLGSQPVSAGRIHASATISVAYD